MKKLKLTYELTVSPENAPLIEVIARQHGWTETHAQPADGFVMANVVRDPVATLLRATVHSGVQRYFGDKDAAAAAAVMAAYDAGAARLEVSIDDDAQG